MGDPKLLTFDTKIIKIDEIAKVPPKQNFAVTNKNCEESQKKCFWSNFWPKLIFENEFYCFRAIPALKTSKFLLLTTRRIHGGPKSKNLLTFLQFSCARTDHLTWPIDRARSQLFRTFFLDSLRSILRPKRPHLFGKFWVPTYPNPIIF